MTALRSVLRVSESRIADDAVEPTIARILAQGIAHNLAANITGALLFTGKRFALVMEGTHDTIEELVQRLLRDRHHRDMAILSDTSVSQRSFNSGQMAYTGPSVFVGRTVDRALSDALHGSHGATRSLIKLIVEFAS